MDNFGIFKKTADRLPELKHAILYTLKKESNFFKLYKHQFDEYKGISPNYKDDWGFIDPKDIDIRFFNFGLSHNDFALTLNGTAILILSKNGIGYNIYKYRHVNQMPDWFVRLNLSEKGLVKIRQMVVNFIEWEMSLVKKK